MVTFEVRLAIALVVWWSTFTRYHRLHCLTSYMASTHPCTILDGILSMLSTRWWPTWCNITATWFVTSIYMGPTWLPYCIISSAPFFHISLMLFKVPSFLHAWDLTYFEICNMPLTHNITMSFQYKGCPLIIWAFTIFWNYINLNL